MLENQRIELIERQKNVLTLEKSLLYFHYAESRTKKSAIALELVAMLVWVSAIAVTPPEVKLNINVMYACAFGMFMAVLLSAFGPHSSFRILGRVAFLLVLAEALSSITRASPHQLTWSLTIYAVMVVSMSPLLNEPLSFMACAGWLCYELALRYLDAIRSSPEALWMDVLIISSFILGMMLNFLYFLERTRAYVSSRRLVELAYIDGLTLINNRRAFLEDLEQACVSPDMAGQFCFLLLDVDDFKAINDQYGHAKGDQVLQHVARCIKQLASHYSCGRIGGEEFGVIFHGNAYQAMTFAHRINTKLAGAESDGIVVTVSIGVAHHHDGLSMKNLILQADQALYRAKAAGKNQAILAS